MDRNGSASDEQKEYARVLGITFNNDVTRGELGDQISKAKEVAPPSEAQLKFARNLKIAFDEDATTGRELRRLITAVVAKRSRAALKENPTLRVGETIMYKENPYTIEEFNRKTWKVKLTPCYRGCGRTVWVMIITVEHAKRVDVIQHKGPSRLPISS